MSGWTPTARSTTATSEKQALTDRDAGTLLIRDAGSPADTRWIDDRDDLPKIIRAGRHIARTRRYIRNYAHEIEPGDLAAYVAPGGPARRRLGQAGRRLDRPRRRRPGRLLAAGRGRGGDRRGARGGRPGHRALLRRGLACATWSRPGIDCVEHATGLTEDTIPLFAERGVAIVPTLVNIATFPQLAAGGEAKFPRWSAHMRRLHARRYDTVRAAYDAGIAGLRRHRRGRLACRTAWSRRRSPSW